MSEEKTPKTGLWAFFDARAFAMVLVLCGWLTLMLAAPMWLPAEVVDKALSSFGTVLGLVMGYYFGVKSRDINDIKQAVAQANKINFNDFLAVMLDYNQMKAKEDLVKKLEVSE